MGLFLFFPYFGGALTKTAPLCIPLNSICQ